MARALCLCGALTLDLPEAPMLIGVCHCRACQRRTGAPLGAGAFYPAEKVQASGPEKCFTRPAESGGSVHNHFCPDCGTTVYWRADTLPGLIGVAVGTLEEACPSPALSVWEQTKHPWVEIAGEIAHFAKGKG